MKTFSNFRAVAAYLLVACFVLVWACGKKADPAPTPTPTPTPATKSAAKDITKFSFAALSPAIDATIDATVKTISATVEIGTSINNLIPTISVSEKATVSPASGIVQDFGQEQSYTVTAEDGSTQVYKVMVKINSFATNCKLTSINTIINGKVSTQSYTYDSKSRLIKNQYAADGFVTYEYDQNDFLIGSKHNISASILYETKYTYTANKLSLATYTNNSVSTGKTQYEYDANGKISKTISTSIYNGVTTILTSTFNEGILKTMTENDYTYELNELGLITKLINKTTGSYSTNTYDKNGQTLKSESFNKDGKPVFARVYEYTTFLSLNAGIQDINNSKGFPSYGSVRPTYHVKKQTEFQPDPKTGELVVFSSDTYDNYQFDSKGRILSYNKTSFYPSFNSSANVSNTYTYVGCN